MATTIPQLKHAFLTGQIRILNAPLDPPDAWRETAPASRNGPLPQRVVDDVLTKANRILRTHNANVFPPMVLEHVCAQIDALYWSQTSTAAVLQGAPDPDAIPLDADLCDEAIITTLPSALPAETASPAQSVSRRSALESDDLTTRYSKARRDLARLSERRRVLEGHKMELRALLDMLRPLQDPVENVQENLVVKDGELLAEIAKMRTLLAVAKERL